MFVGIAKHKTYRTSEWSAPVIKSLLLSHFGFDETDLITMADLKEILRVYGATHFQQKSDLSYMRQVLENQGIKVYSNN